MLSDKQGFDTQSPEYDTKGSSHMVEGRGMNFDTLDNVLELYPMFKTAKLLKTDTDGFEDKILLGGQEYIKTAHPIIFLEYMPTADKKIFDYLREWKYSKAVFYDNFGNLLLTVDMENRGQIDELINYIQGTSEVKYYDIAFY